MFYNKFKIQLNTLIICLLLILSTLVVYWQVTCHDFINYDDDLYVTENSNVQSGLSIDSIIWAFTTGHAGNWHPITWLSHMLDCELYGLNSMGHHWTNLQFHIINTILLFIVIRLMTGAVWKSAFIAALFALHPLHVESVAWVAERKDVLSTFFWFLSMIAYFYYIKNSSKKNYLLLAVIFAMGLMAKPMLVTLPFILLLLDFWPLSRFQISTCKDLFYRLIPLIKEKIPLMVLSIISSIITFLVQEHGGAVAPLEIFPLSIRIANAIISYFAYLGKMVWPHNLAVFYPHPEYSMIQALVPGLLLLCVSFLVLWADKKFPYILTGWFWYLGTLFPVIGIVQVGSQCMADRYTYIPLIGIFIIIAWGISDLSAGFKKQKHILVLVSGLVIICLGISTWIQTSYWKDSIKLFTHTLNVTENNDIAHHVLGHALQKKGRLDEALSHYYETLKYDTENAKVYNNIGNIFNTQKKPDKAVSFYNKALELDPDYANAHNNLANVLSTLERLDDAAKHYNKVLKIEPKHENAHYNFGNLLIKQEKFTKAGFHFAQAIKIKPDYAEAYHGIGVILFWRGEIKKAIPFFQKAVKIKPDYKEAQKNLKIAQQALLPLKKQHL
ncbi:protein O-mannosyl-transferase [Candidatus Magnetomoraceae bacterium gMMP-15]